MAQQSSASAKMRGHPMDLLDVCRPDPPGLHRHTILASAPADEPPDVQTDAVLSWKADDSNNQDRTNKDSNEFEVFKLSDSEWQNCRSTKSQRSNFNDGDLSNTATEHGHSVADIPEVQADVALSQNGIGSISDSCDHDHDGGGLVDHLCSSQRRCYADLSGSEHREAARRQNHARIANRGCTSLLAPPTSFPSSSSRNKGTLDPDANLSNGQSQHGDLNDSEIDTFSASPSACLRIRTSATPGADPAQDFDLPRTLEDFPTTCQRHQRSFQSTAHDVSTRCRNRCDLCAHHLGNIHLCKQHLDYLCSSTVITGNIQGDDDDQWQRENPY